MKSSLPLFFLFLFLVTYHVQAQKLTGRFKNTADTIKESSQESINRADTIIVLKQNTCVKCKIHIALLSSKTNFPDTCIYFTKTDFPIDTSKDNTIAIPTIFHRRNKFDRTATFLISGITGNNDTVANLDSKEIYIERQTDDSLLSSTNEFWLFTGTNLDLIDGPKLRELYFKVDYLTKLTNHSHLFFSFGKSRYFDLTDSVYNASYSDHVQAKNPDSIKSIQGYFDASQTIQTDNIFFSTKYLWKVPTANKVHTFFLSAGAEVQYLTLSKTFNNVHLISADTTQIFNTNNLIFHPIRTYTFNEWNYNFSVGFVDILHLKTTPGIDIKAHFSVGLNIFQYDSSVLVRGISPNQDNVAHVGNFFTKTRIDATVLSPGVSLGFEMFTSYRYPDPQYLNLIRQYRIFQTFFNVSITKVFNLNHISSLFNSLTSPNW